ncbi:UNVERIFIED_ORG: nucleoside-diphosphate-sugar epimerase [Shinella zoogloeoides]|jgi:nucleoside-diphosphate-sugar epimerase|nr:nucleoside-diphosphate-sugar epimerase [Shinella zoogloeoides]
MSRTIAITGASGFLGGFVLRHLHAAGVEATGYSRRSLNGLVTVSDYAKVPSADVIIHCGEVSDAALVEQAGDDYRRHALATLDALLAKAGRIIYASSAMVYGESKSNPRRTNDNTTSNHPYTRLKIEAEARVGNGGGLSLRLANLCGPGQPKGTVLADILEQIGRPGPVVLRNTAAVRDFLWLPDVARLVSLALDVLDLPPVLNAGSGVGISIGELAARILDIAGEKGREIRSLNEPRKTSLWMDITETSQLLNWKPRVTLEQGAASLIAKGVLS